MFAWAEIIGPRQIPIAHSASVPYNPSMPARPQQNADADVDHSTQDEAGTRSRIDQQLRQAGWEADTVNLRFANGTRPRAGKNMAIAEWPTASGPADYVLFMGLKPVAVVEAKRHTEDVAGRVRQAARYSSGYSECGTEKMPPKPWGQFKIPLVFATNGRPFLRQVQEKSGIWFHDLRRNTNHPRALDGWYTPDGIKALLATDAATAAQALRKTPVEIADLHDYQIECVKAIEEAIAAGIRAVLVAMATGTGKTRVAIALLYRLLKLAKFRRILLLVDRETLGDQATNRIKEVRLENLQTLAEIYDIKELDDIRADTTTRLHIATVQGMVKRVLSPSPGESPLPVDEYDCIIVDECHRGYILDRELPEQELLFKDEADYISKYRRVLDHFDAVKIGLTATPALHTTEIFGKPIFTYSYRQAVIDGWLIDHEPPVRIVTRLAKHGIHWKKGETVQIYRCATGTVDLATAPDQIDLDVEAFNKRVITEPFNKAVCAELAAEIDPNLPGKTLIFCANDAHADLVVRLLKDGMEAKYVRGVRGVKPYLASFSP
jgi:type I restriction enzyme, R subunit